MAGCATVSDGSRAHHHDVEIATDLTSPAHVDTLERALACRECGLRVFELLMSSPSWVNRRVESVIFRDHRTIRRSVSVDFSVPVSAPLICINGTGFRLIPFTIFRRRTLVNFDLRSEDGTAVPLLGVRQNQALTEALLVAWAAAVLNDEPSNEVKAWVHDLVSGRQDELLDALDHGHERSATIGQLASDPRFKVVLDRITDDFVAFIMVSHDGSPRRIYKFSYDERLRLHYEKPRTREPRAITTDVKSLRLLSLRRILAAIGFEPLRILFPTPAAENTRSFHFEIHSPPGVEILHARLLAGRPAAAKERASFDSVSGGLPTIDLHVVDVPRGSLCLAQVDLRLARHPWLSTTTFACCAAFLGLFWAAFRVDDAGIEEGSASAVFVGFTAAVVALLWRPADHRMALRLLSGVGIMASASALLLLSAAGLLALNSDWDLELWFRWFAGVAFGIAVWMIFVALIRNRGRAIFSDWEQGQRARNLDREPRCLAEPTFLSAFEKYRFYSPAIRVSSAEGEYIGELPLEADLVRQIADLLSTTLSGFDRASMSEAPPRSADLVRYRSGRMIRWV
jgi:hypothetical protein